MQSIIQYYRLKEDVKKDLANQKSFAFAQSNRSSPLSSTRNSSPSGEEKAEPTSPGEWALPGITISRPAEENGAVTYTVGWKPNDPLAPPNWTRFQKWLCTVTVCLISIAMAVPSSIDAPVSNEFNEYFGVSPVAGSMVTGCFLIGFGVGSLFAGPFSETFGRNIVYIVTMALFMIFLMAKALAPNYGAALAFRFLAGFFGASPLTCAGGSVADMWSPLEFTFALPTVTMVSYLGPILGPIIGAYIPIIGFRWADWIALILAGLVASVVFFFQPETYAPLLLSWKAKHLRELTGDSRFRVEGEASAASLGRRLVTNVLRPFQLTYTEPIIMIFSLYLIIIYIILFTFLNGYPYIFQYTYGISSGLTFTIFVGILVGDLIAMCLIPLVYSWTKKAATKAEAAGEPLKPEVCMYFAMMGGSFFLPISLFWMGWTCYPSVSIWSPIVGSVFFGYGLITVFTTTYVYICFVYQAYAASALTFMTFSRYVVSGGMTAVADPMYGNLGPHWSLTILGCLSALMAPVPFVLYKYGSQIRAMSKNVQNKA